MTNQLLLSRELIINIADIYFSYMRYREVDSAIELTFSQSQYNVDIEDILIKASAINSLYNTVIMSIVTMAEHILKIRPDAKFNTGDISVIDDIRLGHGVGNNNGDKNFYSFATKYAHFHKPFYFPIYDSLVMRILTILNKQHGFYGRDFKQPELKDYSLFKDAIDSLIAYLGINKFGYKIIDKGLWLYAKYYYDEDIPLDVLNKMKELFIAPVV